MQSGVEMQTEGKIQSADYRLFKCVDHVISIIECWR